MKVKSESEVAQLCPTSSDPMDCSLPGSSIHGIFQTRVLEWDAIAFSAEYIMRSAGLEEAQAGIKIAGRNINNLKYAAEKAMAPHSSTLAWKIPWTEEPGGLQSMGSRRVEHD